MQDVRGPIGLHGRLPDLGQMVGFG